ncbi:MAG: DUF2961 domain-containing protein [Sandaracinus sp.]|nr:DUF2961 domain-containing protein [Sandaracinus sp.]MCB9618346.1 DUF2961 domain-containing protein [Sandaracinus sp.]MCB9623031.1 DUF2961 domain-containing protein [Sandaracinus sp.]
MSRLALLAGLFFLACGPSALDPDVDAGAVPRDDGGAPLSSDAGATAFGGAVSYRVALEAMTRVDALATWQPDRVVFRSSTDHASTDPSDATLRGWFANDDRGHYHGTFEIDGRREDVLAHVQGPGVLVRVWSANPAGTLRIYVDDTLVIDGPMDALLSGRDLRFPPPFAYEAAGGVTFAAPIPFARSLRVTAENADALYYQVEARRYPEGTVVEPWSPAAHEAAADVRADVASQLTTPTSIERGEERGFVLDGNAFELEGAGTIRALRLRPERVDEATLRDAVLCLAFDGVETVRVPLGDFFGHGPGVATFDTLLASMDETGTLVSRLPMPFDDGVHIHVESSTPLVIEGQVKVDAPTDTSWRFFAGWRDLGIVRTQPRRDWRLLDLRGEGAVVGLLLEVANGGPGWWGEGDEKIYVDAERLPSWFGTGTEDYFGAAFCSLERYARPFHAQTLAPDARGHVGEACASGPGHVGRTSNLRWHVQDPIRFDSALTFDLELWHWWYADWSLQALVYLYADPSLQHDFERLTPGGVVEPLASLRGDGMLPGERPEP